MFGPRPILLAALAALLLAPGWAASAAPPLQASQRLTYDTPVRDRLAETDADDRWIFAGKRGDLVMADMRAAETGALDPYLTLLDAQGNTLVTDDDSGDGLNARVGPLPLPADGDYTLVAGRYSGGGDYVLTLKNLNTAPALSAGKPLVGALDHAHPTDYFLLAPEAAEAGALLRLAARDDEPSVDPFLALYGPGGLIETTEERAVAELDPIVIEPGQTYAAVVSWNPASVGGAYELDLGASAVALLQDGVEQTGTLDYETVVQRHHFQAQQGDVVRVTLATDDNIAPVMSVSSMDGLLMLFSSEGQNVAEISTVLRVPAAGIYAIDVRDGAFVGETGSYRLRVEWLAAP